MVYKWYMLPIGGLYATYHLLGEPETTIDTLSENSINVEPHVMQNMSYLIVAPKLALTIVLIPSLGWEVSTDCKVSYDILCAPTQWPKCRASAKYKTTILYYADKILPFICNQFCPDVSAKHKTIGFIFNSPRKHQARKNVLDTTYL